MDYAPPFQMGHPLAFALAEELVKILPRDIDHVFFGNSGSEAVDTALKIALAYWQAKGQPQRVRFIGRARGYHGVGFGGTAVGGIEANRKQFAANLLPAVDHVPHTHDLSRNAFSRAQPEHGADFADSLEAMIDKHGADTIAAFIIEPVAGSTGVLIPPKGYLERVRDDLRQARHPADLRRGHHGIWTARRVVRRDEVQRHAGHDDDREGYHERRGADGRGVRARQHLRDGRQRRRRGHRAVPRLHLLGPSARRGRGSRDARSSIGRKGCSSAPHRSSRTGRTPSTRCAARRTSSTFARSVSSPASSSSRGLVRPPRARLRLSSSASRLGCHDSVDGRHARPFAAADHRERANRQGRIDIVSTALKHRRVNCERFVSPPRSRRRSPAWMHAAGSTARRLHHRERRGAEGGAHWNPDTYRAPAVDSTPDDAFEASAYPRIGDSHPTRDSLPNYVGGNR